MPKKTLKPADRGRIEWRFEGGRTQSQPLLETALACIRQWVAIESMEANTLDEALGRASARANLRKVAELAINAEAGLFVSTEGGRKGGTRGTRSYKVAVLAEADRRQKIDIAAISAIAKKLGVTERTVRDHLTKEGRFTPQGKGKKNGK